LGITVRLRRWGCQQEQKVTKSRRQTRKRRLLALEFPKNAGK
jgi:hypothetical protein